MSRVSHVINYDIPDTPEAYTHRIGCTGRAERSGEAFTFVTPEDEGAVRAIERSLGERIERVKVDTFVYEDTRKGETSSDAQPAPRNRSSNRGGNVARSGQEKGQRGNARGGGGQRSQRRRHKNVKKGS